MSGDRPTELFLADIADYARDAVGFLSGHTRDTLDADRKTAYALAWCLCVIGEAAKHIPRDVRDRRPDLPWRGMASMRDRLIHGYFGIDLNYIWSTVVNDLPTLTAAVERLRDELLTGPTSPPAEGPPA